MNINRIILFLTTFGGTLCISLSKQNHNPNFIFAGALVILAGFYYLAKISKTVSLIKDN
jgi:hypothetical protein